MLPFLFSFRFIRWNFVHIGNLAIRARTSPKGARQNRDNRPVFNPARHLFVHRVFSQHDRGKDENENEDRHFEDLVEMGFEYGFHVDLLAEFRYA